MKLHRAINKTLCSLVEQYYAPASEQTYHNIKHIEDTLDTLLLHKEAIQAEFQDIEWDLMLQSVLFHDACYQPGDSAAEIEACAVYKRAVRNPDVRIMRIIMTTSSVMRLEKLRAEEKIMHDLDYFYFSNFESLKDAEYKIINEYSVNLGIPDNDVLSSRIEFYKDTLKEAYKNGGLYLTNTFAKYNDKAIANIERRLEELGEDFAALKD